MVWKANDQNGVSGVFDLSVVAQRFASENSDLMSNDTNDRINRILK